MLSFAQMEKHYRLLEIIEQYKRLLSQYDISLKAVRFDGMPRAGTYQADKLGEIMIRKERAIEKLPRLEALADAEAPQVEEAIKAAAGRGRDAIKIELILRARYQSGRDWQEIAEMIREPYAQRVKELALRQLERVN
ncbi:MAG: hypothetical protein IKD59_02115 [Lachnospiraceae bacterium]|nr:hypothetical protein [Lachnospiraceae bacterium]MBR3278161.1 hypothetical protein [Lachnospiraceae bacterium]